MQQICARTAPDAQDFRISLRCGARLSEIQADGYGYIGGYS